LNETGMIVLNMDEGFLKYSKASSDEKVNWSYN
jgi:hypothetical protein